ncbi:protein of unknown function [Trichlorobacter ammonificans]|uniref:Uncharacterized protein n=1 Tax=Trichlorobacter ammonificans TaxID=2916410 RepID=A0ABN8HHL5_9BACT|nr:protein of unknown function [Trichlorobacter ammonificans]
MQQRLKHSQVVTARRKTIGQQDSGQQSPQLAVHHRTMGAGPQLRRPTAQARAVLVRMGMWRQRRHAVPVMEIRPDQQGGRHVGTAAVLADLGRIGNHARQLQKRRRQYAILATENPKLLPQPLLILAPVATEPAGPGTVGQAEQMAQIDNRASEDPAPSCRSPALLPGRGELLHAGAAAIPPPGKPHSGVPGTPEQCRQLLRQTIPHQQIGIITTQNAGQLLKHGPLRHPVGCEQQIPLTTVTDRQTEHSPVAAVGYFAGQKGHDNLLLRQATKKGDAAGQQKLLLPLGEEQGGRSRRAAMQMSIGEAAVMPSVESEQIAVLPLPCQHFDYAGKWQFPKDGRCCRQQERVKRNLLGCQTVFGAQEEPETMSERLHRHNPAERGMTEE